MASKQGVSNDTKTIITVLLLIFLYPIGLIMATFWTNWAKWVKILASAPILIIAAVYIHGLWQGSVERKENSNRQTDVWNLTYSAAQICLKDKKCPDGLSMITLQNSAQLLNKENFFRGVYSYKALDNGKDCEVTSELFYVKGPNSYSLRCSSFYK